MESKTTGRLRAWSSNKFRALFSARQRDARKRGRKFSYEMIAAACEVSRSAVSEWILGKSKPSIDSYFALRDFLGVTNEDLTEPRQSA